MDRWKKRSGIYRITFGGKKCYIGSAGDLRIRYLWHLKALQRGNHTSVKLQRAFNKYGVASFKFAIVEYVVKDRAILLEREQYWLDRLKPYTERGYNISPTATSTLGSKRSEEYKTRTSIRLKGKMPSKEQINNQIATLNKWRKDNPKAAKNKGKPVLRINKEGVIDAYYRSASEAARQNAIVISQICHVCNEADGYYTAGGYRWVYVIRR